MFTRLEMPIVDAIMDRAQQLELVGRTKMTLFMDLSYAHEEFDLRLEDWLKADDMNFCHDICGIQRYIDRETGKMGDCFVPRFARKQ